MFDPWTAFSIDEKGALKGAQEVGNKRGEIRKTFDKITTYSLNRPSNQSKYNKAEKEKK
jgi:hypothetical protein